jgi:large subunit ribosomal protein L15
LNDLNNFTDGAVITLQTLVDQGLLMTIHQRVKVLGNGELKRKITLDNVPVSKSAQEKIAKAGGSVIVK